MKTYSVEVEISAECLSDLTERMEDLNENPINSWNDNSIKEIDKDD